MQFGDNLLSHILSETTFFKLLGDVASLIKYSSDTLSRDTCISNETGVKCMYGSW